MAHRTAPFHTHSLLNAAAAERVATSRHRAGLLHGTRADAALCYCLHRRYLLLHGCVVLFDELLLAPLESLVFALQLVGGMLEIWCMLTLPLLAAQPLHLLEQRLIGLAEAAGLSPVCNRGGLGRVGVGEGAAARE